MRIVMGEPQNLEITLGEPTNSALVTGIDNRSQ